MMLRFTCENGNVWASPMVVNCSRFIRFDLVCEDVDRKVGLMLYDHKLILRQRLLVFIKFYDNISG